MRRFAIEPELLALVRAMPADADGQGPGVDMKERRRHTRRGQSALVKRLLRHWCPTSWLSLLVRRSSPTRSEGPPTCATPQ